jgi:hypothetical protein
MTATNDAVQPGSKLGTEPMPAPRSVPGSRVHRRLAGFCLAIAAAGTPATVAIILWGDSAAAAAGATALGTTSVAAFAAVRAILRSDSTPDPPGQEQT